MRFVPLIALRALLLGWFVVAAGTMADAGIAPYSDPGKIDFDTAMGLLNPYGTWAKVDGRWAYTPLDHAVPYTNGRWIYTEYGWTWLGNSRPSWLTEHYGYWKRNARRVWSWYPGPVWLPQTVEIRASPDAVGWRSGAVDADGNFVEAPADRYTKTDEWTFVSLAQFAGPITPAIVAKPSDTEGFLEESIESSHSYLTYRQLDRPGPHPADFVNLGDGRMFAPMTPQEKLQAQRVVAKPAPKAGAVPQPTLAGVDPEDTNGDPRQVVYWVTMSLPSVWAQRPAEAGRKEVYLYRPDFYQDEDGIQRRISLWLNPGMRATEALHLEEALHPARPGGGAGSAVASVPAVPASGGDSSGSPFVSPFEDTFHSSPADQTPSASTKSPKLNAGAPVGLAPAPAPPGAPGATTPAAPAPAVLPAH